MTKEEWDAIDTVKKDGNIIVLPADKGRMTVVMKEEYVEQCNLLLKYGKTYQELKRDPTSKYKERFVDVLQTRKDRDAIDRFLYKKLYPNVDQPLKFYGLPKVHKVNTPLCPIVSSFGTISYECACYLAKILSPPVGKTEHHVKNSRDFRNEFREITLDLDEELCS